MGQLTMTRAHNAASLDEAKVHVRKVIDDMKPSLEKYVERVDWNADGSEARIKGKHVSGTFTVDEKNVKVELKLSFVATLVKDKIETRIDEALKRKS